MTSQAGDSLAANVKELAIVQNHQMEGLVTAKLTRNGIPTHSCQYCRSILEKASYSQTPWIPLSSSSSHGALPDTHHALPDLAWSRCIVLVSCLSVLVQEDHVLFLKLVNAWHRSQSCAGTVIETPLTLSSVVSSILQDSRYRCSELRLEMTTSSLMIEWRTTPNNALAPDWKQGWTFPFKDEEFKRTNVDPRSADSLLELRTWLDECRLHHAKCRVRERERKLMLPPSRIIKIHESVEGTLRLSLTDLPTDASYIALSYCWGQDQSGFLTTLTNVKSRQQGFTCAELPQTMRDAVDVCVGLGYKHLWIDAVCIVQDDHAQVQSELALMADIYGRADIVLSAACAAASSEGFLHKRLPSVMLRGPDDVKIPLNVDDMLDKRVALSRRAWTLQEHRQAQRLLQYRRHRTIWHCSETAFVDGGSGVLNDHTFNVPSFVHRRNEYSGLAGTFSGAMLDWIEIVRHYSYRRISKADDRLPALAAIARDFAQRLSVDDSAYKAGIWFMPPERMAWPQLLWFRVIKSDRTNCQYDATLSTLPSWSWASCQYAMSFFDGRPSFSLIDQESLQIEVDLRDPSFAYGQVLGGKLTLRGSVQRITRVTLRYSDDAGLDNTEKVWLTESADKIEPVICWDCPGSVTLEDVWLLPFGRDRSGLAQGLILAHQSPGHFTRLGLFYEDSSRASNFGEGPRQDWLRRPPLTTITIH